jgi:hypothetical protein
MSKIKAEPIQRVKANKAKIEKKTRPPSGTRWPDFHDMFMPTDDNPLDTLDLTGDPEIDAQAELDVTRDAFIQNEGAGLDTYRMMVDPEFYFVVCFQSRAQKDEFLEKSGITSTGMGDKYIDGLQLARFLDVDVAPIPLPTKKPVKMPVGLRSIKIITKGGDKESVISLDV